MKRKLILSIALGMLLITCLCMGGCAGTEEEAGMPLEAELDLEEIISGFKRKPKCNSVVASTITTAQKQCPCIHNCNRKGGLHPSFSGTLSLPLSCLQKGYGVRNEKTFNV